MKKTHENKNLNGDFFSPSCTLNLWSERFNEFPGTMYLNVYTFLETDGSFIIIWLKKRSKRELKE